MSEKPRFRILQTTPILIVDAIEPLLPFWTGLGYDQVAEVPHEGRIGFTILVKDGVEVMLQTRASAVSDVPSVAARLGERATVQFIEVDSLDGVLAALGDHPLLIPPRTTDYGMREIFLADPSGHLIGFAEKLAKD